MSDCFYPPEVAQAWESGRRQGRTDVFEALPDQIEIYRAIKKAGVRKHGEIARVIADLYRPTPQKEPQQ